MLFEHLLYNILLIDVRAFVVLCVLGVDVVKERFNAVCLCIPELDTMATPRADSRFDDDFLCILANLDELFQRDRRIVCTEIYTVHLTSEGLRTVHVWEIHIVQVLVIKGCTALWIGEVFVNERIEETVWNVVLQLRLVFLDSIIHIVILHVQKAIVPHQLLFPEGLDFLGLLCTDGCEVVTLLLY